MSNPQLPAGRTTVSRREFVSLSAAAALLLGGRTGLTSQDRATTRASGDASLHLRPRYHRWHVDPGIEWLEANTDHAFLDWTIPRSQAALVLVDVWDRHYLQDAAARAEAIIAEKFVPLLAGARRAGLPIIHAPSPAHAIGHPNWTGPRAPANDSTTDSAWPPADFRSKSGPFAAFARPAEPREPELARLRAGLKIHPQAMPVGDEPVIATGEELHALCSRRGILFLIFAGFNTNACILSRDYGTLAMSRRGYEVILLRDCTTGMESRESLPSLGQTGSAILLLEMFGQYTITSDELLAGLGAT